ncbi:MAG TPA: hypothetical protein PLR74_11545 [Agriterribacter sp.]|nr:hypothetical protein [Agriterribacter sp.]
MISVVAKAPGFFQRSIAVRLLKGSESVLRSKHNTMKKLITSINVTLNGFCDHTAVIADDELHQNANALLRTADTWSRRCNALL